MEEISLVTYHLASGRFSESVPLFIEHPRKSVLAMRLWVVVVVV